MRCNFCHMEGDPAMSKGLSPDLLTVLVSALMQAGARKVKWLGGEPLLRRDLPGHIATIRGRFPDADLSIITSGTAPLSTLQACFAAGLSRANLSIHGWTPRAFAERGAVTLHPRRDAALYWLVQNGAPLKLNYVYRGDHDDADLSALFAVAAALPVVVNVLDDLSDPQAGHSDILNVVRRLRGPEQFRRVDADPLSLDTLHLHWSDGLQVEVKHQHLGAIAPFNTCVACPKRAVCREGILALRLTHQGHLAPCMDRPDLQLPLLPILERGGEAAVVAAVRDWEQQLLPRMAA